MASSLVAERSGKVGEAREGSLVLFIGTEECRNREEIGRIEDDRDHRG
jgi:hypothetical protein